MRKAKQPARTVSIILRCGNAVWPNDVRVLGEGLTLAAALKDARRALMSFQPLPGNVLVSWPVGAGFDVRYTPLVLA